MSIDLTRARVLLDMGARPEYVYFIHADGYGREAVKIGTSHDPRSRMATMSVGGVKCPDWMRDPSGVRLMMLGYIAGDIRLEREIHRAFREHRQVGEWFDYAPLAEVIDDLLDEWCVCVTCEIGGRREAL